MSDWPAVVVEGQTIRKGTSIFDTLTDGVMWFRTVHGGYVELDTLDGITRMTRSQFVARVRNRTLVVESHRARPPE